MAWLAIKKEHDRSVRKSQLASLLAVPVPGPGTDCRYYGGPVVVALGGMVLP